MEILICIWLLIISLCIEIAYWCDKVDELNEIKKKLAELREEDKR